MMPGLKIRFHQYLKGITIAALDKFWDVIRKLFFSKTKRMLSKIQEKENDKSLRNLSPGLHRCGVWKFECPFSPAQFNPRPGCDNVSDICYIVLSGRDCPGETFSGRDIFRERHYLGETMSRRDIFPSLRLSRGVYSNSKVN